MSISQRSLPLPTQSDSLSSRWGERSLCHKHYGAKTVRLKEKLVGRKHPDKLVEKTGLEDKTSEKTID